MKPTFHLAGRTYTVKEHVKARVRLIANEVALDTPLMGEAFAFMSDLFAYHPQAESKIGPGIEAIVVRRAVRNPANREFWVRHVGTESSTDVSWTECLRATTADQEFRNACRLAVKPDTQEFCDRAFAQYASGGQLRCPLTGAMFGRTEAHVDHHDPWPFVRIVAEFVRRERIDPAAVQYDGLEHGATFITLSDRKLALRFVKFHNDVANLRVVSSAGHLRRSRLAVAENSVS